MAKNSRDGYGFGLGGPLPALSPQPIIAVRDPQTSDLNFEIGTPWVNTVSAQVWHLARVLAGVATWALSSPGASDVDTLTGDGGGAISPAGGNITLAGGTNITTAGAVNTITYNLDAAITLATSVTSPLYTAGAGVDTFIEAVAGQDIVFNMADNAGATNVLFTDSDNATVFSVDSNGGLPNLGAITTVGAFTQTGGAVNIGMDNLGSAINIGGGNVIKALAIGGGAAAHTLALGSAAAGAFTIDTAAGISLDSVTASNFTITGAADLTLSSTAGSVIVNG
ncbi:hypothetical protein LCGC14_2842550, partial [marine sediment metagenome]